MGTFVEKVLKLIRRLGTEKLMGSWRNHMMRNLANYLFSLTVFILSNHIGCTHTEHVARLGKMTNAPNILIEKFRSKRPRGKLCHRWKVIAKVDRH